MKEKKCPMVHQDHSVLKTGTLLFLSLRKEPASAVTALTVRETRAKRRPLAPAVSFLLSNGWRAGLLLRLFNGLTIRNAVREADNPVVRNRLMDPEGPGLMADQTVTGQD